MREGYEGFVKAIKGKKAAVAGMGISNRPLPGVLLEAGASSVACFDKNYSEEAEKIVLTLNEKGFDVSYYAGEDYLSKIGTGYDYLFRTPGLRPDIQELVNAAAVMTSEMEMFLEYCPAKVYGVTGSDGKTTTTTLVSKFLEGPTAARGGKVYLGGNIGTPLLEKLPFITEKDRVCVELSSFQLIGMKTGTDVAVITNVSPNHLNYHVDYDEYLDAKGSILNFRDGSGICVLNRGNEDSGRYFGNVKGKIRTFSVKKDINGGEDGAFLRDGKIFYRYGGAEKEILDVSDILILGKFNWENYMAAYCAAADEADIDEVRTIAATFGGVHHRMEFIREFEGVKYYNSSIDSSPNRTINALSIFDRKVVLVAGGKDKGISYDEIGPVICDKVRAMVLTGPTAPLIEKAARDEAARRGEEYGVITVKCTTYEEAVNEARRLALPGENVVLSPASTSFDMFRNFEERGEVFSSLVRSLK